MRTESVAVIWKRADERLARRWARGRASSCVALAAISRGAHTCAWTAVQTVGEGESLAGGDGQSDGPAICARSVHIDMRTHDVHVSVGAIRDYVRAWRTAAHIQKEKSLSKETHRGPLTEVTTTITRRRTEGRHRPECAVVLVVQRGRNTCQRGSVPFARLA